MSEVKRYTAWAAEVTLPRGTMVVLAADYDALLARAKTAEADFLAAAECNVEQRKTIQRFQTELATERLRADVAVKDANDAERRVAELQALKARVVELESALRLAKPCVKRDLKAAVKENFGYVNNDPWACAAVDARNAIDAALAGQQQQGEPKLPEGWTNLLIEYESGYPEDVAFGPQRMMDRLKKWLDAYFAMKIEQSVAKAEQPAAVDWQSREIERLTLIADRWQTKVNELERELTPHRIAAGRAMADAALAPAAAVMPERMTTIPEGKTISYAAGYEAALDAVANLNRNTVPLELLERICADALRGEFATADRSAAIRELRAILGANCGSIDELTHDSDCSTNNHGCPDLIGPCDCCDCCCSTTNHRGTDR